MKKYQIVAFCLVVLATFSFVTMHASALGITLPGVGSINIGGSSGGSGSSGGGSSSGGSSGSSIGNTVNSLLNSVVGSSGQTSGDVGAVVTQILNPTDPSSPLHPSHHDDDSHHEYSSFLSDTVSTIIPGGLTLGYTDTLKWTTDNPVIKASISDELGSEHSLLLDISQGATSGEALANLTKPSDWSSFDTLGIWVLPDSSVKRDELKLKLSSDPSGDNDVILVSLPELAPDVWQYVQIDLKKLDQKILRSVRCYGFVVQTKTRHIIHSYPFQLGPDILHHFRIVEESKKKTSDGIRTVAHIIAEDRFGNKLTKELYDGTRKLIFSSDSAPDPRNSSVNASIVVAEQKLGTTIPLKFVDGISESFPIVSRALPVVATLSVSDGSISSSDGDLSLGLSLGGANQSLLSISDARNSILDVVPLSGTVGIPETITVTAYNTFGSPQTTGGDTVIATVTGANNRTVPLIDLGIGIYQGVYTPSSTGTDMITARLNGQIVGQDTDGTNNGTMQLTVKTTVSGGGSTGSGISQGGGGGSKKAVTSPTILESGKTCTPYLTKYIHYGSPNDPLEVQKLQAFLKRYDFGKNVSITGIYDMKSMEAVKEFQRQHLTSVLSPWRSAQPTGYVYILTLRQINILECMREAGTTNEAWASEVVTAKAPYCPYFKATATKGAKGDEIAKAQQFLKDMKLLDPKAPLGTYGTMTWKAIWEFQTTHLKGVSNPTGNWGPLTVKEANKTVGCAGN